MVKLRVAARIISEDEYLRSLQGSASSPVKGEKRLVVVVREPYKWQIGTLALEVQRAYQSCYQVELPTIKYLKDNEDDCDLDPRAYVSDLLLDEGKAQIDASDQRVTIKVILEQGRALREGSVAIGSQLDHPVYQIQLEQSSRPPVPKFPPQASSLGKRPFPADDDYASTATVSKRPRQVEIPETQREDQTPISSIEHEDGQGSLELVEGTQFTNPDQGVRGRQSLLQLKQESPELRKLLQNVAPATLDELEELAERPPTFGSNKRQMNGSAYPRDSRQSHQPNGLQPSIDSFGRLQRRSQGPITPPSELSRRLSTSANHQSRRVEEGAKPTARSASTSASKFKRRDIYDYPESDIDDSQMSPRSRQAQLSNRDSRGRLSHIESLQSPREHGEGDDGLSISQAIDVLDDESVFEDSRSIVPSLPAAQPVAGKRNSGSPDEFDNSIYEDAEMGDGQHSGLIDTNMSKDTGGKKAAEPQQLNEEDKENAPSATTSTTPRKDVAKATHAENAALRTPGDIYTAKSTSLSKNDQAGESRPEAKRVRKRKSDTFSADGSQQGPVQRPDKSVKAGADKKAKQAPKSSKKTKESQRVSTLDSPGEQLSQNLWESTGNQLPIEDVNKRLASVQQKSALTTPAKKNKPNQPDKAAEGPSSGLSRSTASKKDGTSTTPAERTKNKRSLEKPAVAPATPGTVAAGPSPTIVLPASQQDQGNANLLTKPLPNWGSANAAADKRSPSRSVVGGEGVAKEVDSGKNSSAHLGLTPEEIKILESRKDMTKEQYEAEKKRRQLEAKKIAEGQKKQGAASKKKPTTDRSWVDKSVEPQRSKSSEPKPAGTLTKSKTPKSHSTENDSPIPANKTTRPAATDDIEEPKQGTTSSGSAKANSVRRESSSTTVSKSQIADSKVPPKTPAKVPTKSPSVKSSTVSKTPRPSVPPQPTGGRATSSSVAGRSSTPAPPIAKTGESKAVGKTPAKTPLPARKPTLETAKRLVDLHEVVRSANKAAKSVGDSMLSRLNAAKQKQKPSIFTVDDDDDDEEEESDDSEDDDKEGEVKKVFPATRKTAGGQDESKKRSNDKHDDDDDSSTSSTSSEEVGEKDPTGNRTNQPKGKPSARPVPRTRDERGASDDDDSSSSDDNGSSDEDSGEGDEL
ncbi:uncharacterized protein Z520_06443 [Fonsecaea multimorphosa CBS 102226]|uniref:Nucleolar protein Dnt1-like N-terminal domain-containing protein n=1 Tax=Fonsecaea multimorphosa CBS 102226 TaxID=1442371 RepID=A0A0D2H722_9EURO|nr:uncharacterized protein Z520_06443 [Fonsecaea multimorphosa CBS 102226]KIX97665.1 hypothetical protein Z520_06443 [Fonsecaea multimorphosa CBS 102226]OAL23983.1 hypothetical protein AYO22_06007 [Fonsecaea multimorphosa]